MRPSVQAQGVPAIRRRSVPDPEALSVADAPIVGVAMKGVSSTSIAWGDDVRGFALERAR